MTNINICSLYTLSKSKESAKYLWFLLRCKLSNCTELQFHIHALMILRKIRLLLSNNPFIHFPVWHFDSSYNINFVLLEDLTMHIIITTISCVPLTSERPNLKILVRPNRTPNHDLNHRTMTEPWPNQYLTST